MNPVGWLKSLYRKEGEEDRKEEDRKEEDRKEDENSSMSSNENEGTLQDENEDEKEELIESIIIQNNDEEKYKPTKKKLEALKTKSVSFTPVNSSYIPFSTPKSIASTSKMNRCTICKVQGHNKRTCSIKINNIHLKILALKIKKIVLLKQKEVIQWMYGDISFLDNYITDNKASQLDVERKWISLMMKKISSKQQTYDIKDFSCRIYKELQLINGEKLLEQVENSIDPFDFETDDTLVCVKSGYYYLPQSSEKIVGNIFKHVSLSFSKMKDVNVFIVGGRTEQLFREDCNDEDLFNFLTEKHVYYTCATDALAKFK